MGDYLHRTTKVYRRSISPNELPESLANYIEDPDLSAVVGVSSAYWIITGDVISEMSQAEKDAVDAAVLATARDAEIQAQIDSLESTMRQVVKLIVSELNIVRGVCKPPLPNRTFDQVKTQLRSDLGT